MAVKLGCEHASVVEPGPKSAYGIYPGSGWLTPEARSKRTNELTIWNLQLLCWLASLGYGSESDVKHCKIFEKSFIEK